MGVPTNTWLIKAGERNQKTVYLVIISLDTGDLKLCDRKMDLGKFDALPVLDSPAPIGVTIEPFSGKSSVSRIVLKILDKNSFFNNIVSAQFLLNRKVTIKIGFEDIDEADFFTEYIGKIKSYDSPQTGRWNINLEDTLGDLTETVPEEKAGAAVADTAFWNLPQVTGIVAASAQDAPPQVFTETTSFDSTNVNKRTMALRLSAATIRLYQVGSITVNDSITIWDIGSATPVTDGVVNSLATELLGDNVVDVMLNVLKRVNIPDENIQVSTFISARDEFLTTIRVRRVLGKATKALNLIQELAEISFVSVFPDGENRLAGKFFAPPNPHEDVYQLDTTRISLDDRDVIPDATEFANRIVIFGNHDGSQDQKDENFGRVDIFADADSQKNEKEVRTRSIRSLWLNDSVTDETWYTIIGAKLLKRLNHPPRHLRTSAPLDSARATVADMIGVTHPSIPGQPTGKNTPGVVNELWQLLEKRTDVVGGKVTLELLDARLDKQAAFISHSFQADYPDASGLDRRHAYIGTANSNLVNNGTEQGFFIQ